MKMREVELQETGGVLRMERIMQEKISADHLLYVSLKYTKTTDVMLNLITRWKSMIEMSFDAIIEKSVKEKTNFAEGYYYLAVTQEVFAF